MSGELTRSGEMGSFHGGSDDGAEVGRMIRSVRDGKISSGWGREHEGQWVGRGGG